MLILALAGQVKEVLGYRWKSIDAEQLGFRNVRYLKFYVSAEFPLFCFLLCVCIMCFFPYVLWELQFMCECVFKSGMFILIILCFLALL